MYAFKQISDWLPIEYFEGFDLRKRKEDIEYGFEYEGDVFFLKEFIRVHANPILYNSLTDDDSYPEYIHGIIVTDFHQSVSAIEIDDAGECVRVYQLIDKAKMREDNVC